MKEIASWSCVSPEKPSRPGLSHQRRIIHRQTTHPEKPQSRHAIEVKADGSLAFDATALSYEALAEKLTALGASKSDYAVMLRAERNAPYTFVAKVLEACRSAGIANVAISATTDEDKQTAKGPDTGQSGKTHAVDPAAGLARARLDQAEREMERISELHHQKLVSQPNSSAPKLRSKYARPNSLVIPRQSCGPRLEQAGRELERLSELYKQKLVSQQELERAKAEVEIRKAGTRW
jgi:hypothetical protein